MHADIEAIAAAGCHSASAITCLTVQNTRDVQRLTPVKPELFRQQANAVLDDLPVAAIKIGLIGEAGICKEIAVILQEYPQIPAILDPVLAAGGGTELSGETLLESIRMDLLPHIELATPNSVEARRLSGENELALAAAKMISMGCKNVLITGTHETSKRVINTLYYGSNNEKQSRDWPRLHGSYHGSGCTLTASIAARIALGSTITDAVAQAQEYTWQTLQRANSFGSGQSIPNRLFDRK